MTADLTVMGKVLGGGLPAAAYGGRARPDADDRPRRRRLPGGNALSGNPLAVAAGLATLEHLDADAYARLAALTDRLAAGLRDAAADAP